MLMAIVILSPEGEAKGGLKKIKVGKALKGVGDIVNKGLKKAKLPTLSNIKRIMKGLPKLANTIF